MRTLHVNYYQQDEDFKDISARSYGSDDVVITVDKSGVNYRDDRHTHYDRLTISKKSAKKLIKELKKALKN